MTRGARERACRFGGPISTAARCLALVLCAVGVQGWPAPADSALVLTQVPKAVRASGKRLQPSLLSRFDLFAGARLVVVMPGQTARVLTEGFSAACDPDVSFDGTRVLFAGRKAANDPWRIWEIGVDGRELRAISPAPLEARKPIYVSTLFTLDSPEPWFTTVFAARPVGAPAASFDLYNVKLDGQELRQLTYNLGNDLDPVQRWDGRVLYAAERTPLEPGLGTRNLRLHEVHLEGADPERYGPDAGGMWHQMPCSLDNGLVVFVELEQPSVDGAGQLAAVEESRPAASYRRLTEDRAFQYLYPAPAGDGGLWVSRRRANGKGTAGIVAFDPATRVIREIFDDPQFDEVQVQAVRPRRRPDGRSTIVNPTQTTGVLYGLNCYDAEPRLAPFWRTGLVQRVRLIEGLVPAEGAGAAAARRLVGEAPVEADGSFNLEVPADTPLSLQALDADGLALATCGWVWVKPKESRGCIGCHEDPERIPENQYVLALRRPSTQMTLPAAQRRVVSFRQDIVPLLARHCAAADCHGGSRQPLVLPLTASSPTDHEVQRAYANLTAPLPRTRGSRSPSAGAGLYLDAGRARTSWLVWQVLGRSTARPWDEAPADRAARRPVHRMPPAEHGLPLSEAQILTLIQWIDLGAPLDSLAPAASATPVSLAKP